MKTLVEYLFDNIVIGIITESKKVDDFMNIFLKQNKDLQDGLLRDLLMRGDPTSVSNDHGDFVGKYGTWIGNLAKEDKLSQDDVTTLHDALTIYHANKSKVEKDIKDIKTLDELISIVKNLDPNFKPEKTKAKIEQNGELEKVYDDKFVTVYVPHTYEASRYIGGDTHWCTASSDGGKMFNYYLERYGGEYYVIIRKKDGAKFQFHPESEQLMNAENMECDFSDIFDNKKDMFSIERFFTSNRNKHIGLIKNWIPEIWSVDDVESFLQHADEDEIKSAINKYIIRIDDCGDKFSEIRYKNKYYNFIDKHNHLLSDEWFKYLLFFEDGFAVVQRMNDKWNFIDTKGKILCDEDYDKCQEFSDGYGKVQKDGKWGFVDKKGKLITHDWYDKCFLFHCGFALVRKDKRENGKYNFIDTKGNEISKVWFDGWDGHFESEHGYANVTYKGIEYLLDTKGRLFDAVTMKQVKV